METGWVVRTFKGRGKGKSASRYVPTLNVLDLASRGKFPELLHANETVEDGMELLHANEAVPKKVVHPNEAVGEELLHANETKTPLLDPRTKDPQGSSNGNQVSAPALAPGLSAAPGGDGFENIWKAYGKLGNKAAAREAFATIAEPDVEHIVARATSWAASAKPGRKRMPLEKWLSAEKYDEADRKTARAKPATARPAPANSNEPPAATEEWDVGVFSPFGTFTGTIVNADVIGEDDIDLLVGIDTTGDGNADIHHTIHLACSDAARQARGTSFYRDLCEFSGAYGTDDPHDFLGTRVTFTINNRGQISYHERAA